MEKLIIDIPTGKSQLVRQLLEALGVKIKPFRKTKASKEVLTNVSVWSEDDIKAIEEASGAMTQKEY